jgi:16S rRNA (guanine527-N7)-methyltransferase
MLKINGYLVCLKGNFLQEKIESKNALSILKSDIILVDNFLLPKEKSVRNLVLIQKKFKTDKKYPRKFDKIKKNPL